MVIGKISQLGTLVIFASVAVLFLRQAHATSFGSAGQDVGQGLTGISTGISNLFSSFTTPLMGLFNWAGNLFNFGNSEGSGQSTNTYGHTRNIPTPNTSRNDSNIGTQHTIINTGGTDIQQRTVHGTSLPLSSEARSYYKSIGVDVS